MALCIDEAGLHSEGLTEVTLAHHQTHTRITLPLPATPQQLSGLWRGQWSVLSGDRDVELTSNKKSLLIVEGYDETLALTRTKDGLLNIAPVAALTLSGRSSRKTLTVNITAKSELLRSSLPNNEISHFGVSEFGESSSTSDWIRTSDTESHARFSFNNLNAETVIHNVLNREQVVTLTINGRSVRTRTAFSGVKFVPEGSRIRWQLRYRKMSTQGRKIIYGVANRLLPIRKNSFFFQSYLARALSDSPRALYEYIAEHDPSARLVWSLNDINVPGLPNTITVRPGSIAHYYYLATSHFVISNTGLADGFEKRASQIHLQTWHGSPIKRVGRDKGLDDSQRVARGAGDTKKLTGFARRVSMWDYLIAANSLSANAFNTAWRFGGEMLCMGYPRNDALFDEKWVADKRKSVREQLDIPNDHTVALWAPTWTDDAPKVNGRRVFTLPIDLNEVAKTHKLTILVKLHYLVANQLDDSGLGVKFINVSDWDDVNDLFPASDVLISDFSGVIPDYALTNNPVIIYSPNFDEYLSTRGTYVDLEKAGPGPVVRTQTELFERLADLAWQSTFAKQRESFAAIYREYESGHASASIYTRVVKGEAPRRNTSSH